MHCWLSQTLLYFITYKALPCLPLSWIFLFIEPCTEEDRVGEVFIEDHIDRLQDIGYMVSPATLEWELGMLPHNDLGNALLV